MRVISGSARRTNLVAPSGLNTRPTTDRIKETLFNMINNELYDCIFVDLFSGSGAIGIEALSRGAEGAYFIENNRTAINCIKENLEKTHLESKAFVIENSVLDGIKILERKNIKADIIFMDPPYNNQIEKEVVKALSTSSIIDENTTIIVEASLETKMDYLDEYSFDLIKRKDYKTNSHIFLIKK